MDVAYETQAPDSLDPRGSPSGGRCLGRPAVRGQRQQRALPPALVPVGAEDIAKERRLLQHQGGGDPGRAPPLQGV